MVCCHYVITGQVQGVGFRYFAHKKALAWGIVGWARNLYDGRVEILAQGNEESLRAFEAEIAKGPSRAVVTNLQKRPVSRLQPMFRFVIEEDGEDVWQENI